VLIGVPLLCIAVGTVLFLTTSYGAVVRASVALVFDPEDVSHYRARAAAYGDLEAHERAVADYTQAIALVPDSTYLYTMRAFQYLALGRLDDAIADLGIAVLLDPDDCNVYRLRGDLWRQRGDEQRARADYERVLAFGDACTAREDAAQVLAQMGPPLATPTSAEATSMPAPQPTPTTQERQLLLYQDFDAARDPVQADVGEVRWEEGELRILVSQAGKDVRAVFGEVPVTDVRVHVTARPVTLYPGSLYGVVVRVDPTGTVPGGYWFRVRGDGACRACIEQDDGVLTCPSDWQSCPVQAADGDWIVVEAIASTLTFRINDVLIATFDDATYGSGAVGLWVANGEETTDTLVAFDDLALFEP
jgi:hypothetical protein